MPSPSARAAGWGRVLSAAGCPQLARGAAQGRGSPEMPARKEEAAKGSPVAQQLVLITSQGWWQLITASPSSLTQTIP